MLPLHLKLFPCFRLLEMSLVSFQACFHSWCQPVQQSWIKTWKFSNLASLAPSSSPMRVVQFSTDFSSSSSSQPFFQPSAATPPVFSTLPSFTSCLLFFFVLILISTLIPSSSSWPLPSSWMWRSLASKWSTRYLTIMEIGIGLGGSQLMGKIKLRKMYWFWAALDLSQGDSLVPRIPLWWRLRVTTDKPVAKVTREIVTP